MSDAEKQMLSLRLPPALIERIRKDAEFRGQTLTTWLTRASEAALVEGEKQQREALALQRSKIRRASAEYRQRRVKA